MSDNRKVSDTQSDLQENPASIVYRPSARVVDQSNAYEFLESLRPFVGSSKALILDMSKVNFLSSAGLGSIVTLVRDVQQKGGKIRICTPTQAVNALFKMVHLSNLVPIDNALSVSIEQIEKP